MISVTSSLLKVQCDECGDILLEEEIDNDGGITFNISEDNLHLHMHCEKCCAEFNTILAESYQKSKSDENELLQLASKHDIDITRLTLDEQIYTVEMILELLKVEKKSK